ncbi:MAG TPA: hypothetical protein VN238_13860, partial [Solirubrobacteraceae bacterium]|nr:hypothetical protein [Solirubrobacteraceae bacterium]
MPFTHGAAPAMLTPMPHRAARVETRDLVLMFVLAALGVVLMVDNVVADETSASPAAIPLFLLVTVPIVWRRRDPLAVLGVTLAGLLLHVALFGTIIRCGLVIPIAFILAFTSAARLELPAAALGLAGSLGLLLVLALSDTEVKLDFLPVLGAVAAGLWGIGRVVRSRGRMVEELESRTSELRGVRDDRARIEVATDRAQLSGELDALLQRRLHDLSALA